MAEVEDVDVIVIGMGVAGETVAGPLAEGGLRVVGIEAGLVGGECPYWGCVPSKMAIRAANAIAEARRIDGLAGSATVVPDWAPVAARIRAQATDNWNDQVAVDRFVGKGGIFVRGHGRIEGADTVVVGDRTFRASRAVVIAAGTSPAIPPIPGLADVDYWTNHHVLEAEVLPASIVVLGAGAIGSELAQVMARFGTRVDIVEAQAQLLPLEEPEVGPVLKEAFEAEGISVHVGVTATSVLGTDGGVEVELSNGTVLAAERVLVATGRRTNVEGLGLESIGLESSVRFIPTDDRMRVVDGVWSVGDITGKGLFTHMGMHQGGIARNDILDPDSPAPEDVAVPRVTFTDPEVGAVGLTEAQAIEAGISVATALVEVSGTARGWLHASGNEGLIKLVSDRERGVLVGATSMGPHGGEVLGLLALAVHEATPIKRLGSMIYAYPTFHKGIEDAVSQLL
jgi:pyruvate/2-oxoglutarate dehydrogenase complex dihydrolipoamide dehydrogenase (E3) component